MREHYNREMKKSRENRFKNHCPSKWNYLIQLNFLDNENTKKIEVNQMNCSISKLAVNNIACCRHSSSNIKLPDNTIFENQYNLSYIQQQQQHFLKQKKHRMQCHNRRKSDDEISHFFKSIIPLMVKIRKMKNSNIKNVQIEIKKLILTEHAKIIL